MAWGILKSTTSGEYKKLVSNLKVLKELRTEIDSIDSNTAGINYFFEFYNFLKKYKIKSLFFLGFSDSRGRLYIKSNVSIQSS